jgi:hypothetical protein
MSDFSYYGATISWITAVILWAVRHTVNTPLLTAKSEIRNPKQIQSGGEWGNEENGGGGLSANFANFREFFGRGNFNHGFFRLQLRTSKFEPCNAKQNPEIHRKPRTIGTIVDRAAELQPNGKTRQKNVEKGGNWRGLRRQNNDRTKSWGRREPRSGGISTTDYADFRG